MGLPSQTLHGRRMHMGVSCQAVDETVSGRVGLPQHQLVAGGIHHGQLAPDWGQVARSGEFSPAIMHPRRLYISR
jgi:hypothetical protein